MRDEELIRQFQQGNEQAFDELVRRYQGQVHSTCYRFLNDVQDSQDAAQDIFVKVYAAVRQFKPEAKFSTWLYRVIINHCLNVLRARKRRQWLSTFTSREKRGILDHFSVADEDGNPGTDLEKAERIRAVRRAIDSLNSEQKTAVILHRYQGLSYQEIADIMQTSIASVESRLHRAKLALGRMLADYLKDD